MDNPDVLLNCCVYVLSFLIIFGFVLIVVFNKSSAVFVFCVIAGFMDGLSFVCVTVGVGLSSDIF